MGLYLLNISVDAPDITPQQIPEDLSFNDQESIIEIVIEKVLGYEDAIKEYDDNDTEDHNKKKDVKIDLLYSHTTLLKSTNKLFKKNVNQFFNYNNHYSSGFIEIDSPPPKV